LIYGVSLDIPRAPEESYAAAYLAWRKCLRHEFSGPQDMLSLEQRQRPFREVTDAFNGDNIFLSAGCVRIFNKSTREIDIIVAFYWEEEEFPFVPKPRQSLGMVMRLQRLRANRAMVHSRSDGRRSNRHQLLEIRKTMVPS